MSNAFLEASAVTFPFLMEGQRGGMPQEELRAMRRSDAAPISPAQRQGAGGAPKIKSTS
jgi:hypothetical protein